jgi:hypothetical protein
VFQIGNHCSFELELPQMVSGSSVGVKWSFLLLEGRRAAYTGSRERFSGINLTY